MNVFVAAMAPQVGGSSSIPKHRIHTWRVSKSTPGRNTSGNITVSLKPTVRLRNKCSATPSNLLRSSTISTHGKDLASRRPTLSERRESGTFDFSFLTVFAENCEIQCRLHALACSLSRESRIHV